MRFYVVQRKIVTLLLRTLCKTLHAFPYRTRRDAIYLSRTSLLPQVSPKVLHPLLHVQQKTISYLTLHPSPIPSTARSTLVDSSSAFERPSLGGLARPVGGGVVCIS